MSLCRYAYAHSDMYEGCSISSWPNIEGITVALIFYYYIWIWPSSTSIHFWNLWCSFIVSSYKAVYHRPIKSLKKVKLHLLLSYLLVSATRSLCFMNRKRVGGFRSSKWWGSAKYSKLQLVTIVHTIWSMWIAK